MEAQVVSKFGDSSVFETVKLTKPNVKAGYVIINVLATSINPIDYKMRNGNYPDITADFPAVLHSDVAGVIEEVGEGVTDFKKGDEVYGCAGGFKGEDGALSEFMLADAKLIALKPNSLTMREAAALPLVSITAWEALYDKIDLKKKQNILIHGATGGVGHIAVQLAKCKGVKVYATISSDEKAKIAKSLGVDEVINYRVESVQEYVDRLTEGKGFDVVFDTVGGANIDASMQAVAFYGDVVTILSQSSHDLSPLFFKSANLHVVFMLLPLLYNIQRKRHGEILQKIAKLVDDGAVKPLIDDNKFTFDAVGDAHKLLESGKALGKVVVSR